MTCRKHQYHFAYFERPIIKVETEPQYDALTEKYGPLISPYQAACMAGVTRQRIYNLIEIGKFTKILAFDMILIPKREFDAWKQSDRECGRPGPENSCRSATISKAQTTYDAPELFAELPAQRKGRG